MLAWYRVETGASSTRMNVRVTCRDMNALSVVIDDVTSLEADWNGPGTRFLIVAYEGEGFDANRVAILIDDEQRAWLREALNRRWVDRQGAGPRLT